MLSLKDNDADAESKTLLDTVSVTAIEHSFFVTVDNNGGATADSTGGNQRTRIPCSYAPAEDY